MNNWILTLFVLILLGFHKVTHTQLLQEKVRESICALWCVDAVFSLCGTIISFYLYHYELLPYLTVKNICTAALYLVLTILFLQIAPSGLSLLKSRRCSDEELLMAEYRFNDTLSGICRFFLLLLLLLPFLKNEVICGGLCFIAFMILLPLSLRQAHFWLKNLRNSPTQQEILLLKRHYAQIHFKKRNWRL